MIRLTVRLTPRGGRDAVDSVEEDDSGRPLVRARVSAPPADGAANAALIKLLAKTFGAPKSAVRIASGQTSRLKIIDIDDAAAADRVRERMV